ncbi:MAG: hypothetical protein L0207_03040 [Chlamydiae bacterium]|nr:hypothetical protein [Chlamydiota bacterium]
MEISSLFTEKKYKEEEAQQEFLRMQSSMRNLQMQKLGLQNELQENEVKLRKLKEEHEVDVGEQKRLVQSLQTSLQEALGELDQTRQQKYFLEVELEKQKQIPASDVKNEEVDQNGEKLFRQIEELLVEQQQLNEEIVLLEEISSTFSKETKKNSKEKEEKEFLELQF